MCCRANWVGNGCDGNVGGPNRHECTLASGGTGGNNVAKIYDSNFLIKLCIFSFFHISKIIQIKLYDFLDTESGCLLQNKYLAGYANGGRTAFCSNCYADAKDRCKQG